MKCKHPCWGKNLTHTHARMHAHSFALLSRTKRYCPALLVVVVVVVVLLLLWWWWWCFFSFFFAFCFSQHSPSRDRQRLSPQRYRKEFVPRTRQNESRGRRKDKSEWGRMQKKKKRWRSRSPTCSPIHPYTRTCTDLGFAARAAGHSNKELVRQRPAKARERGVKEAKAKQKEGKEERGKRKSFLLRCMRFSSRTQRLSQLGICCHFAVAFIWRKIAISTTEANPKTADKKVREARRVCLCV